MKTRKTLLIALVATCFVLTACAKAAATPSMDRNEASYAPEMAVSDGYFAATQAPLPAAAEMQYDESKSSYTASGGETIQQMIIMNADLTIAVDDPAAAMEAVNQLAKGMGGFVVSSYVYKYQTSTGVEVPEATITVRVPAERLDEALDQIKALTGDADKFTMNENISGTDVTQQYTDLKSRLRNLEEANNKLTELYDKAVKPSDALEIFNQKMSITEQIEVIKGQMQYYEQSAAKSAISVRIVTKASIAPVTIAGWQPQGVARDAVQALVNFGKGLVNFLIWLIILIVPVIVVLGAPIFFLVRWLVRRSKRNEAARQEALRQAMAAQTPPMIKK